MPERRSDLTEPRRSELDLWSGHVRSAQPWGALVGRWTVLAAGLVVSERCGRGGLAGPSPFRPSGWRQWALTRPPAETAVALVRLAALGAGSYALVIVTVALVGRIGGHRPTVDVATRLVPGGLRPILALTATAAVVAGISACGPADTASPPRPVPPRLRSVGPAPGRATPGRPSPHGAAPGPRVPGAAPRLRRIGPAPPGAPSRIRRLGPAGPGARPPRSAVVPPDEGGHREHPRRRGVADRRSGLRPPGPLYVVRPGDSFWSIAAAHVGGRDAPEPADPQRVAEYWSRLVRANVRDLPVPGQPDLLFPGDRICLPAEP